MTPHERLTKREREIVELLGRGASYKDAATRFHISIHTVRSHTRNAYVKLDVHNARAALLLIQTA